VKRRRFAGHLVFVLGSNWEPGGPVQEGPEPLCELITVPRAACHPLASSSADPKVHSPPKTPAPDRGDTSEATPDFLWGNCGWERRLHVGQVEQGGVTALSHWTLTRSSELQGGCTGPVMELAAGLASKAFWSMAWSLARR